MDHDSKESTDIERCEYMSKSIETSFRLMRGTVPSQHQGQMQNARLEGLIIQNEGVRNMSGLETISAGWIICNSWAGIAATFALAIAQGGPATLVYGPIIMCVLVGACAISLAELASVYPTVSSFGRQIAWVDLTLPGWWTIPLGVDIGSCEMEPPACRLIRIP